LILGKDSLYTLDVYPQRFESALADLPLKAIYLFIYLHIYLPWKVLGEERGVDWP
jgi:hypothetical protein